MPGSRRRLEDIDGLVIAGNTAMLYLLTNTPPHALSKAPFRPTAYLTKS